MGFALEGDFRAVSISSILQLLQDEGLSGILRVDGLGKADERGEVGFDGGVLVQAQIGALTGRDALLELFVLDATRFRFDRDATPTGDPLGDVFAVVMDGYRLRDEWARLASYGIGLGEDTTGHDEADVALRQGMSVATVADRCRIGRSTLLLALMPLVEAGRVSLERPQPPPAPSLAGLDYFEALDLGRQAFRENNLARAIQAFERALACRPGDGVATQNLRLVRTRHERTSAPNGSTPGPLVNGARFADGGRHA